MNQEMNQNNNQDQEKIQEVLGNLYDSLFRDLGVEEFDEATKENVLETLQTLAVSKFKIAILESFADQPEVITELTDVESMDQLMQVSEKHNMNAQAVMHKCFSDAKLELARDLSYIQGSLESLKNEIE